MAPARLVDTHVHLWDPRRLRYAWLRGNELLNRRFEVQDYYPTHGLPPATEGCVFIECDADPGQSLEEIKYIEEQAQRDPRVRAIVAHAPLERGWAIEPLLAQIVRCSSKVRGIRRILQTEVDLRALLQSAIIVEGVRLLQKFDLHFEITVTYDQMECVPGFVQKLPEIPMVLDHCGKPGIRLGLLDLFRRHVGELARYPNVYCKLSGLTTEAEHGTWTDTQMFPYIDAALQAFGPHRLLYGSDWPVCLQATSLPRWIGVVERGLAGCTEEERSRIFFDNANALYRTGLDQAVVSLS